MLDKSLDDRFVIFGILTSEAIGDNGTDGRRLVAEKEGEAVYARTLHLVICDTTTIVAEGVYPLIKIGRSERQAHYPTLRTIEAGAEIVVPTWIRESWRSRSISSEEPLTT